MCEKDTDYANRSSTIIFENVADQYVKGENITVLFTISHNIKVNPDEDQIGIIRVGCTNMKECLAYASVQFRSSTTSESIRHGTAIFLSSSLPITDGEFYQFTYILQKTKTVGLSKLFQLNCAFDDIDLLSNGSTLAAFDDFESQKNTARHPCQTECCSKIEANLIRSQLAATIQLTKDQATEILAFERRLMQANEFSKISNERQMVLEQQLRDFKLTSEKYQRSMQCQIDAYAKQAAQREEHIHTIETTMNVLKEELPKKNPNKQAYMTLKTSLTEIERRCVKHQKNEIDLKRQLSIYQNFVNQMQGEMQYLNDRLSTSSEEYNTLLRKCDFLERQVKINHEQIEKQNQRLLLCNTYENQPDTRACHGIKNSSAGSSITDIGVSQSSTLDT